MIGAFIFGSINGAHFHDHDDRRRIYSFYSYSYPGNPWVHQMIIHRAMMAIFSYTFSMYSLSLLPQNIAIPIILLLPFFIGAIAACTYPEETVAFTQYFWIALSYLGVILITNPLLFD